MTLPRGRDHRRLAVAAASPPRPPPKRKETAKERETDGNAM
jgi:hypothetical protein